MPNIIIKVCLGRVFIVINFHFRSSVRVSRFVHLLIVKDPGHAETANVSPVLYIPYPCLTDCTYTFWMCWHHHLRAHGYFANYSCPISIGDIGNNTCVDIDFLLSFPWWRENEYKQYNFLSLLALLNVEAWSCPPNRTFWRHVQEVYINVQPIIGFSLTNLYFISMS